jgi:hypothetical protein
VAQLTLESLVRLVTLDTVPAKLALPVVDAVGQALPLEESEAKLAVAQLALMSPV